ncbi:hypothetical protein [Jannaschia formosa]|uniref:hypothetical protein n=1 Tax=Jannaschia formosa TaxID=2259592 RepID=UPI000E1BE20C|nr:hypothetical protein [Jannaschia formosa]TFL18903.1 hypothetical protein DR046_08295 [Jannaschia formosa]
MRTRVIIGIIVAIAVIIGGLIWYNNQAEQARLEEQQIEQAAIEAREAEQARVREEEEALEAERERQEALEAEEAEAETVVVEPDMSAPLPEDADTETVVIGIEEDPERQEALEAEEAETETVVVEPDTSASLPEDADTETVVIGIDEDPVATDEAAGAAETDLPVVGDEAAEPEGAIVVEPADDAVIIDADETASTARIVDEAEAAPPTVLVEPDATAAAPADTAVVGATSTADPAELLTPERFDQDQVLALINESDELTDDQRSTLRALVSGTADNPATVDSAIDAIRAALDLPPME